MLLEKLKFYLNSAFTNSTFCITWAPYFRTLAKLSQRFNNKINPQSVVFIKFQKIQIC